MSHFPSVPIPLELDDVQRIRASAGEVRLRLSGRWLGGRGPRDADEALLVVQLEGRRHRFAPEPEGDPPAPGRWTASFLLPGWAEPRPHGQAALWIGEAVIPIPPGDVARRQPGSGPPALGSAVPADLPEGSADLSEQPGAAGPPPAAPLVSVAPRAPREAAALPPPPVASVHDWSQPPTSTPETPRSGPLADLLLKETVAALHGELEARSAEAARLRSALAGAQAEFEARTGSQGELEGTLGELGAELRRLMEAVEEQHDELERRRSESEREREEFDGRLRELTTARDAQEAEVAAVREELTAARDELTAAREDAAGAWERQVAELAALRDEHAAGLGALREERAAELRDLHARLHAAETAGERRAAEAAALREELAGAQVAREAARGEAAGLRAELERLGSELAVTRERVQSESGDLGQANRLLADARALAEQLRRGSAGD